MNSHNIDNVNIMSATTLNTSFFKNDIYQNHSYRNMSFQDTYKLTNLAPGTANGESVRFNEFATHESRLDAMDTLNTTQDSRLTTVEGTNTTQNSRLDSIETLNTTQNGRLGTAESNITSVTTTANNALPTTGGAMSGPINLNQNGIENFGSLYNPQGGDQEIRTIEGELSIVNENGLRIRKILGPFDPTPVLFDIATFSSANATDTSTTFHGTILGEAGITLNSDATNATEVPRYGQLQAVETIADNAQLSADNAQLSADNAQLTANNALPKAGGEMEGNIDLGSHELIGVGRVVGEFASLSVGSNLTLDVDKHLYINPGTVIGASNEVTTKAYVDAKVLNPEGDITVSNDSITGLRSVPVSSDEATSKDYVDTSISTAQSTADTALANASIADGKAVTAQSTANTALANASTADGKAVTAQSTANTAITNASNADGKAVSAQTTANNALPKSGGTMTGNIEMSNRKITTDTGYFTIGTELGYGTRFYGDHHHVNISSNSTGGILMNFGNTTGSFTVAPYLELYRMAIDRDLAKFAVPIDMEGNKITSTRAPVDGTDVVNKSYVDALTHGWVCTATSSLDMAGFNLFNVTNVKSSKLHPYTDGLNISTYFLKGFETEVTRFTEDGIDMLGGTLLNCGQMTFATNTLVNLAGSQLVNPSSLTTISNNIFNVYRGSNSSAFLGLRGDVNAIQFHDNGGKIMGCDAVTGASFAVKNLAEDTTYASFGATSTFNTDVTFGGNLAVSGRTLNTDTGRVTIGTTWGSEFHGEYFGISVDTNGAGPIVLGHGNSSGYCSIKQYNGSESARFTSGSRIDLNNHVYCVNIYTNTDNTYPLGSGSLRFTQLYATSATINTSDERQKENVVDSDLGLDFVNALRPVKYTWKVAENIASEAVEYLQSDGSYADTFVPDPDHPEWTPMYRKKTTPRVGVRPHYGMLSQEVKTTIDSIGVDFAGYIHDAESDSYGLRYSEFIAPMIKAIQELSQQNAQLVARIEALESA